MHLQLPLNVPCVTVTDRLIKLARVNQLCNQLEAETWHGGRNSLNSTNYFRPQRVHKIDAAYCYRQRGVVCHIDATWRWQYDVSICAATAMRPVATVNAVNCWCYYFCS